MAQTKTIQLLRSQNLYESIQAAKTAMNGTSITEGRKDGEMLLARYNAGTTEQPKIQSLICIWHDATGIQPAGWTFIEDVSNNADSPAALRELINNVITGAGLATGTGAFVAKTGDVIIGNSESITDAVNDIADYIQTMDLTQVGGTSGDVITGVSQADGKVSATKSSLTEVVMTGYAADTTKTGAIVATDTLEQAFNKVENAIAAGKVHSNDQSITVAADATNGGTNIEVKVDGTTIVKDGTSHALKSGLTLAKITTGLSTNVKEAYQLQDASGNQIGSTQIDIYKDSALKEVYLGASTDTIDSTTGTITKNTVDDPQSMNFAYQLADGTYSLTKVDVSKFLTDSEFSDGLQVNGGVVSVKKDTSSGKVRTAATPSGVTPDSADDTGLVDVLTVSSNGVKVDNIQAAINYAVRNASTDLAISAQGDNYITAAVDATDNKKINVSADVQSLTATAGTPGTYDSTTGAQSTAPTAGTLSGTADSLADGADIATKVKTYVDGAIAIEVARSDAKNLADIKTAVEGLDGTATASSATNVDSAPTTDFKVLTKVVEVDGKILETTETNGSTAVTLKKVAATGAAADVSIADAGGLITATTVEGALQEIATNVNNNHIVSGDVIVATTDTSNNQTTLSVTTGNGLEKTGTNNDTLAVKQGSGITVDSNGVSVNAGDGLVIDGSGDVDVNVGNGLEISSDAVAIKIDSESAMATSSVGMLTVSSSGLKLNDTWDCGTF